MSPQSRRELRNVTLNVLEKDFTFSPYYTQISTFYSNHTVIFNMLVTLNVLDIFFRDLSPHVLMTQISVAQVKSITNSLLQFYCDLERP